MYHMSSVRSMSDNLVNSETNKLNNLHIMAMSLKGLYITKSNRFSSFKVQELNTTILSARITNKICVGDVVL